jgi:hypothetical protein
MLEGWRMDGGWADGEMDHRAQSDLTPWTAASLSSARFGQGIYVTVVCSLVLALVLFSTTCIRG